MLASRVLRAYQPMIRFPQRAAAVHAPASSAASPIAHPAAPTPLLPNSFAAYRQKAQQHGPLTGSMAAAIGVRPGSTLGPVFPAPSSGLKFDRNELPPRFHRPRVRREEIEAVESGGAFGIC